MKKTWLRLLSLALVCLLGFCACAPADSGTPSGGNEPTPSGSEEPSDPTPPVCEHLYEEWTLEGDVYTGTCKNCGETVTYAGPFTEGLSYSHNNNGTCAVSVGTWDQKEFVIVPPVSPDGDLVTAVADNGFSHRAITGITLPPTVRTIGGNAFYQCYNLETLNLPDGLLSIGDGALWSCRALKALIMPDSMTRLGVQSVYDCPSLTELRFSEKLLEVFDQTFDSFSVPNLVLPAGLKRIGNFGFSCSHGLQTVVIPDEVTGIGNCAFQRSDTLKSVTLGKSVRTLGTNCFDQDPNLEEVIFLGNELLAIPDMCFYGDASLTLTLPDSVRVIGEGAFYAVKDVTLPADMTEYRKENGLLLSGNGTKVYACFNTDDHVDVPETVTSLGNYAFQGYKGTVNLPASLTTLGRSSLRDVGGITVAEGNTSFKVVGDFLLSADGTVLYAYFGTGDTVDIPEGVETIEEEVFGIIKLDNEEFAGFCDFTTLILPHSLVEVKMFAFDGCDKHVTTVYYRGALEEWRAMDIDNTPYDTTIGASGNKLVAAKKNITFDYKG